MTSATETAFVERFGKKDATAVKNAAEEHANGINSANRGSDEFRWALTICIGYECITRFRGYHGISADEADLKSWVLEHGALGEHDGDVDYLSLATGEYSEWVSE
jgi:hypothetical protein